MFQQLLAKSETKKTQAETIFEHTKQLLSRLHHFQAIYPNALRDSDWELLRLAATYHDLGKANTKFQNKLRSQEDRTEDLQPDMAEVPHNYLSCAFVPIKSLLRQYSREQVMILLSAIYYHHERPEQETYNMNRDLLADLTRYVAYLKEDFDIREEVKFDYGTFITRRNLQETENLYHFVLIKGLLNKLDYAASGHYEVEVEQDQLASKMGQYFKRKNYPLNDLQQYLLERQDDNHVVVASTGIGKTEAALFWLGNDKGIFTLPLKVSINAIYERLIHEINCDPKKTGLLHSDMHAQYAKQAGDQDIDLVAMQHSQRLSLPLTVTTLDQIIDFIGLYPGFEMKLATFSYSKIIIDEIQMYSPKLAAFIVLGLKYMTDMGGKFLIMTATLPPIFVDALHNLEIPFTQNTEPFIKKNKDGQVMLRHYMAMVEDELTIEHMIAHNLERKVLIIVNTVSKAQQLFEEFKERGIDVSLLHSRFIASHRQEKEQAILKMGKKETQEVGIWITTQLVEASVDIDFDILFTELSEATSLFQRMGRVYRNRDYTEQVPNVYVFTGNPLPSGISENDRRSVVDYTIFEKSKEVIRRYDYQAIDEKTKMEIIETIYNREFLGKDCRYLKVFDEELDSYSKMMPYQEKQKPTLRDIQNQVVIPRAVYVEHEGAITDLIKKFTRKISLTERTHLLTELQQFTVPIATWAYDNAVKRKNGEIYTVLKINNHIQFPVVTYKYTEEQGLVFENDRDALFL